MSMSPSDIESNTEYLSQESKQPIIEKNEPKLLYDQSKFKSFLTLGLLVLIFSSNQWSRQVIYYLCNFSDSSTDITKYINTSLNFDKEFYALLASVSFTGIFSIISIFSGNVADNYNRTIIVSLSCFIWSFATYLQSLVSDSLQLIPLRITVGASQAFFNPAAFTLLSEIFPNNMLASVNGILSSGIYIGGGLASLSILLNNMYGWRETIGIVGIIGIVLSVLAFIVIKEPRKSINKSITLNTDNSVNTSDQINILGSIIEVLSIPESRLILFASLLRFAAGFTIGIWKAPFVFEKFPNSLDFFSSSNAFIVTIGGLLSSLIGGFIADKISNNTKNQPRARLWIPAIGSLLAIPAWTTFILTDSTTVAAISLLAEYLVAECWFGPTLATLYNSVPSNRKGVAQGLFSIILGLANVAPYLVGKFTSGSYGNLPVGLTILWVVDIAYLLTGLSFLWAAFKEDKKLYSKWTMDKLL